MSNPTVSLSVPMNQNQKDLVLVFIIFLAVGFVLFVVGFHVLAVIVSGFGGLACLERVFRWYNECGNGKEKLVSILSGVFVLAPFIVLIAIYGKSIT